MKTEFVDPVKGRIAHCVQFKSTMDFYLLYEYCYLFRKRGMDFKWDYMYEARSMDSFVLDIKLEPGNHIHIRKNGWLVIYGDGEYSGMNNYTFRKTFIPYKFKKWRKLKLHLQSTWRTLKYRLTVR